MHVSPTEVKQSTFNIDVSEGNQQQHLSQLEHQLKEVFVYGFYDSIVDY